MWRTFSAVDAPGPQSRPGTAPGSSGGAPGGILGSVAASRGGCGRMAYVDCGDDAPQRFIDCSDIDSLPRCGFLSSVVNLSAKPIEIQAFFQDSEQWRTVVPIVGPQSTYSVPQGAIWLPRQTLLRSTEQGTMNEIQVFGALGDGARLVQR